MLAEHRPMGSTGGPALYYHRCMRNGTIITLSLFLAPLLACGDDAPTRPEDGTVQVWDECMWDGQIDRALCEPDLACAWHGICVPRCEAIEECSFDGFQTECGNSNGENVCLVRCNEDQECPQTGGAAIHCLDFHCVRDP